MRRAETFRHIIRRRPEAKRQGEKETGEPCAATSCTHGSEGGREKRPSYGPRSLPTLHNSLQPLGSKCCALLARLLSECQALEPLLCATIGHTPPVMRDNSWYRRHTCSRVASVHMCTRGRDQPVILGAQTVQPTELQIVGGSQGAVNAAYLSPSAYATVRPGRYGVEVRLST